MNLSIRRLMIQAALIVAGAVSVGSAFAAVVVVAPSAPPRRCVMSAL